VKEIVLGMTTGKDYDEDQQREDGLMTSVTGANSSFLLLTATDKEE